MWLSRSVRSLLSDWPTVTQRLCARLLPPDDLETRETGPVPPVLCPRDVTRLQTARSFQSLPGPSTGVALVDFIRADTNQMHVLFNMWRNRYGDVFKFKHPLRNMTTVVTFRPQDAQQMFKSEGIWPIRPGFFPMRRYKYQHGIQQGLFSSNGSEWDTQRQLVHRYLLNTEQVRRYLPQMDSGALWLVEELARSRDERGQLLEDFLQYAYAAVFHVIYKLNYGSAAWGDPAVVPLIQYNARSLFHCLAELEMKVNVWRFLPTVKWKRFSKAMGVYHSLVDEWCRDIDVTSSSRTSEPRLLLELSRAGLNQHALKGMTFDLLFGGIDTTGNALSFLMYRLATNPQSQQRLYEEIDDVIPAAGEPITAQNINQLPYLRACIKESLRLNSPVFGLARMMGKDIVLDDYRVPKGTVVMVPTSLTALLESQFSESSQFLPERWLKTSPTSSSSSAASGGPHPFCSLPFSHGRRMCVGRRLAEQELIVFIARIIQRFQVSPSGEDLKTVNQLICQPDSDLRFVLHER